MKTLLVLLIATFLFTSVLAEYFLDIENKGNFECKSELKTGRAVSKKKKNFFKT